MPNDCWPICLKKLITRAIYDSFDDKAAQAKWQNVVDFTQWLAQKGSGGKDGTEDHRSLLDLTQMVALMTMMDGKDEDPDAIRMSTLHASKGLEYPHVFLVGVEGACRTKVIQTHQQKASPRVSKKNDV